MCSVPASLVAFIYMLAVYTFTIYLRIVAFEDYFECFACKELNFRNQNYDYIIVGSGPAGSIVARRLAENKDLRILLLEAGSSGNNFLQIPATGLMLQNSVFDWGYRTVPQKNACLALNYKSSLWPMGKILGGTSMLNNMIYVRGHPDDYARWYENYCNFNYSIDIQPYFEKLETGPKKSIELEDAPFRSNISDYFLQAGACLGFGIRESLDSQPGFSHVKLTMKKGTRWTPYHQIKTRKNLVVITNAFVEKILFRNKTEAVGVKYSHLDDLFMAKAKRGVILSAGVVGTPKILMLSGIGPRDHLDELDIPVRVDLPVGNNLQDHVATGMDLLTLSHTPDLGIKQMMSPVSVFEYFVRSRGPWTTVGCETIAFFNSEHLNVPEMQFMIFPLGVTSDGGSHLRHLVGITDELWRDYFEKIERPSLTVLPVLLHPQSRGTVRLRNKNPHSKPIIDPKYLSVQHDVDVLVQGIELIKEMIETPPMKMLGMQLNQIKCPGCEKFDFDTRDYWECYIRHFTFTVYHPVGTCKMGDVVGDDFKVFGTSKLYVVDGSVLPDLPSGNPMGPIMLMAEKASDVIKHQCWKSKQTCCSQEIFGEECNC